MSENQADVIRESNDTLYVLSLAGLDIVTHAEDGQLLHTNHMALPHQPQSLKLDGTRLWVLSETGVQFFDVSIPEAPLLLGEFESTEGTLGKGRLRNWWLEVAREDSNATELLVLEFDALTETLLHEASPKVSSVWFAEERTWARSLDSTSVFPIEVQSGPLVVPGGRSSRHVP